MHGSNRRLRGTALAARRKHASRATEPKRSLVEKGERFGAAVAASDACRLRVDPTAAHRAD
jgi:hypothetical protein